MANCNADKKILCKFDSFLYGFKCISPQSNTEFKSLLKRKLTQIFAKGNKSKIKKYSLFNLCLYVLIRVSSDK
nr:MAG TPA: hypothetical protein [Caudoviricetes sp.]